MSNCNGLRNTAACVTTFQGEVNAPFLVWPLTRRPTEPADRVTLATPVRWRAAHDRVSAVRLRSPKDDVTFRRPNGSHAKLCGQGPRAEARAARRLSRMTFEEPRELQPP